MYIYIYKYTCTYSQADGAGWDSAREGLSFKFYPCSGWLGFMLVDCWDVFQKGSLGRFPDADPLFESRGQHAQTSISQ